MNILDFDLNQFDEDGLDRECAAGISSQERNPTLDYVRPVERAVSLKERMDCADSIIHEYF